MPLVKMLKTTPGSENGLHTSFYMKDYKYNVSEALCLAFMDDGACEILADDPVEEKAQAGAPDNKMMRGAPEDKGGIIST